MLGYDDDLTLLSVVSSPCVRVTVADSMNRDLGKVSELCDQRIVTGIEKL